MSEIETILEDEREIRAIYWNDTHNTNLIVGGQIEKIIAYGENGMHCSLPYIAVYSGSEIVRRVPAWQVEIEYKLDKESSGDE